MMAKYTLLRRDCPPRHDLACHPLNRADNVSLAIWFGKEDRILRENGTKGPRPARGDDDFDRRPSIADMRR